MALNLSTLTNSTTSGDILAEALATGSFLELVPVFHNLAKGSNKGSDAKQTTASNQPKALPLVNGSGYVYLPNVTSNAPAVTFPNVPSSTNYKLTIVADIQNPTNFHFVTGATNAHRFAIYNNEFFVPNRGGVTLDSAITTGLSTFVIEETGSAITLKQNDVTKATVTGTRYGFDMTHISFNGQYGGTSIQSISGLVKSVVLSVGDTESVNIDFSDSSVADGASSFTASSGQTVTINKSGQDPATLVRFNRLRFSGASGFMTGSFASTISSGYMFLVFRVLGNGGDPYARLFALNSTGQNSHSNTGVALSGRQFGDDLSYFYAGGKVLHANKYDDALGNVLHQFKFTSNSQLSRFNGANDTTRTDDLSAISAEEYIIGGATPDGNDSGNIDILALSLFPSSITDNQAAEVVSYYNSKFSLF